MATALIILAAGQGSRMQSDLPKVMHELAGAPLFAHALLAGAPLEPERVAIVVGHGGDLVEKAALDINPDISIIRQEQQLGTGHATLQAAPALLDFQGDVTILYGDTPFVSPETLTRMRARRQAGADLVVLGFDAADPGRYGRLITHGDTVDRIVEYRDATEVEKDITICNSGVICADAAVLFDLLQEVGNDNASGEYYLTDIVGLARERGLTTKAVTCPEAETLGINTRRELAAAETQFQASARAAAIENGVRMAAPDTVIFAYDTRLGRDAVIEPYVVFGTGVTVENGARIRAFSHLEGCHVARDAIVGPYARLRPGAELAEAARVGNFVEIKNAQISAGAKVNHLSYIGDAFIGEATNIGAGTITCNYDGFSKHHTHIGARSFVGSNTMLVAPVTFGDEAMSATGTIITGDVPDQALAVGRARMEVKPGLAARLFEKLRKAKDKRQKGG